MSEHSGQQSAVLFLRHTRNTPDVMQIYMEISQGLQEVRVMKLKNYTLDEILKKKLYLLLPFYILVHENRFKVCNEDAVEREKLKTEYKRIAAFLGEMVQSGNLNEYERNLLASMILKVAEHCWEKYEVIKKGIQEIMGGVLLDYPAKTILNKGLAQGRAQGRAEGRLDMCVQLVKKGIMTLVQAAAQLGMSEEEFAAKMS